MTDDEICEYLGQTFEEGRQIVVGLSLRSKMLVVAHVERGFVSSVQGLRMARKGETMKPDWEDDYEMRELPKAS